MGGRWGVCVCVAVPRGGPRNLRVFDATTSTLTSGWDHAEGPVQQYKIGYAPMTGDPITEFVSTPPDWLWQDIPKNTPRWRG